MRIAIVNKHPHRDVGGSELQCDFIARHLVRRGHTVHYLAVGVPTDARLDTPYQVIALGKDWLRRLKPALEQARPDVVYWRFNKNKLRRASNALRQSGAALVFGISHITDVQRHAPGGPRIIEHHRGPWAPLRHLISTPKYMLRFVRTRYNHTGFRRFTAATTNNEGFLGALPIPCQSYIANAFPDDHVHFAWPRPYVAWVGSIKPYKQPEHVLPLADALQNEGIDVLMVGRIDHPRYDSWTEAPPRENIRLLGEKDWKEVNGVIRNALAVVHTGIAEGFPNIFIQAWKAGVPTISRDYDPEGIIMRRNVGFHGVGVPEMADYVRRLRDDEGFLNELRARALALAAERFNDEENLDRMERFLVRVRQVRSANDSRSAEAS